MSTSRCRVCLSENGCIRNIFTDKCSNGQSYAEALTSCLDGITINVVKNETVPSHICESCVSGLETWVTYGVINNGFVSKYLSSNRIPMNATIKVEPESEEYPQVQQIETSTYVMADIKNEEICVKTEPDDEYFRVDVDKKETDLHENCTPFVKTFNTSSHHVDDKLYKCIDCEKTFSKIKNLKQHLRAHIRKKPFVCDYCKREFRFKSMWRDHLRTHTGEKPYECDYCEKSFTKRKYLTQHVRTQHLQTQQLPTLADKKQYECDHCKKGFRYESMLREHLRIHSGEKPYKCEHCGRKFSYRTSMMRHVATHTDVMPYDCYRCGKKFRRQSTLTDHLRTHTGEKPFKCNRCKKAFSTKQNMRKHIQGHTEEEPYKCRPSRTEPKRDDFSVGTADIKTEEIHLKTEPDDEYFL